MQHHLVNEEYLSTLIDMTREQNDEGLIRQLFQNLQNEYHLFLRDCAPLISQPAQKKNSRIESIN